MLSIAGAARIIGSSRAYVSTLVNHSDEGVGIAPALPQTRVVSCALAEAALAVEAELRAAETGEDVIGRVHQRLHAFPPCASVSAEQPLPTVEKPFVSFLTGRAP